MNVQYPNCVAVAPVLTTILAVYNNRCFPLNGPHAVPVPDLNAEVVSKPITRDSSYYNEQMYTVGLPIKRRTVYFNESGSDLIITQDMVPKDDTLHLIGLGDVSFNSITINAERVNVTNLKANNFVWTKASKESSCKDCGTIRLRASGRFFKCSATPTFENVIATVMAPSCKIRFVDSQVTILRDKSSPKPDYINTTITDFTDLIEIFGPKYETEYFTWLCRVLR